MSVSGGGAIVKRVMGLGMCAALVLNSMDSAPQPSKGRLRRCLYT